MRTIFHVVATPDGLDLKIGEEADLPDLSVVLITFDVPVSRLIDGIPELRELVSTLTRERDEARYQLARSYQSEKCTLDPQTCKEAECFACGVLMCPHAEPMHLHHDGCPACHGAALAKARGEGASDV